MSNQHLPPRRTDDLVTRQLDGETVIYDTRTNQGFCLNETMQIIWEAMDGSTTYDDMLQQLNPSGRSDIDASMIINAVEALKIHDLVAKDSIAPEHRVDFGRRSAAGKVLGVSAFLGAPAVSTFSIPSAYAQASQECARKFQSCGGTPCCPGCFCAPNGRCQGPCSP